MVCVFQHPPHSASAAYPGVRISTGPASHRGPSHTTCRMPRTRCRQHQHSLVWSARTFCSCRQAGHGWSCRRGGMAGGLCHMGTSLSGLLAPNRWHPVCSQPLGAQKCDFLGLLQSHNGGEGHSHPNTQGEHSAAIPGGCTTPSNKTANPGEPQLSTLSKEGRAELSGQGTQAGHLTGRSGHRVHYLPLIKSIKERDNNLPKVTQQRARGNKT